MAERYEEGEHADGSSAKPSTMDGRLTPEDIHEAPFVEGTDPLGDQSIERRRGSGSVTPQLVVFTILGLVFAYFLVSDIAHGEWAKAALGVVVLAICGFAVVRELRRRR